MTRRRRLTAALVLVGFAALATYAFVAGIRLDDTNPDAKLGAAPFVGRWLWRFGPRSFLAIGVAIIGVTALPWLAKRTHVWITVAASTLFAVVFGWALAIVDGWSSVIVPVVDRTEYWAGVRLARPFHLYLSTFVERGLYHSVHVRGHPPGMMLLLLLMRAFHLRSPWAAAGLSFVGIAATVVGVSVTVHRLSGPEFTRRVAPLLAFAPFAVWQVTSADAFFSGVAAGAIALAAVAATSKRGAGQVICALTSGVLTAATLHLTYGATMLIFLGLGVAIVGTNHSWYIPFAVGVVAVFATFWAGGFWWLDGVRATEVHYWAGTAKFRPPWYFLAANFTVLGFSIGIPTVASLALLPTPKRQSKVRWTVLPIAALLAVLAANVSQMSKGETERIWVLFMPWLVVAGLTMTTRTRSLRVWLALQAVAAIVLQAALISKW